MQTDRQTGQFGHKNSSASNLIQDVTLNLIQGLSNFRLLLKFIKEQMLKQVQHDTPRKGFTLAEILLVITIIGVVASLTLPNLIANIQDQQLKIAWKSTYSTIAQASKKLALDNEDTLVGVFTDWAPMKTAYLPYFIYLKTCNQWNNLGNCWHNYGNYKYLNGTLIVNNWDSNNGIILNNGVFVQPIYVNNSSTCTNTATYGAGDCGYIVVDVNGFKQPNTIGKDIFYLRILKDGTIKPFGFADGYPPSSDCVEGSTNINNSGRSCSTIKLL